MLPRTSTPSPATYLRSHLTTPSVASKEVTDNNKEVATFPTLETLPYEVLRGIARHLKLNDFEALMGTDQHIRHVLRHSAEHRAVHAEHRHAFFQSLASASTAYELRDTLRLVLRRLHKDQNSSSPFDTELAKAVIDNVFRVACRARFTEIDILTVAQHLRSLSRYVLAARPGIPKEFDRAMLGTWLHVVSITFESGQILDKNCVSQLANSVPLCADDKTQAWPWRALSKIAAETFRRDGFKFGTRYSEIRADLDKMEKRFMKSRNTLLHGETHRSLGDRLFGCTRTSAR